MEKSGPAGQGQDLTLKRSLSGHARWAMCFALLLLAVTAVPVFADELPEGGGEGPMQASEYPPPDLAGISAAHRASMEAEEKREAELQEPLFVAQRESSRDAYADINDEEAEELLRSTFGQTLSSLNAEPARLLSDVTLEENLGNGSAVIASEGRKEIFEAGLPVEARNGEGELGKVDVTLEQGPKGFEPENPLVETTIGDSAEEGVELGEGGEALTLTEAGAEESAGRLLGDKNVFFPEVEAGSDTDLMVSPTSAGVELFDMLRSVKSPETLHFHLELPEGDTLKLVSGFGVEILDSEGSIAGMVHQPHAEDAQGTEVPVELGVEGNSVVLRTHHREEDLAYPILVDPVAELTQHWEGWWQGENLQGLQYWTPWASAGWADHFTRGQVTGGQWAGVSGLFESIENGQLSEGGGEWYLASPNLGVSINNVGGYPFWRYDGATSTCQSHGEPYDFEGLYDLSQGHWNELEFNQAWETQNITLPSWGHELVFGLWVDRNFESPCWRDLVLGGIHFGMADWGPPVLTELGQGPSGWITSSTKFSVYAAATDGGLGVKQITFTPEGKPPIPQLEGCEGNYGSLCPSGWGGSFSLSGAGFAEGERQVQVSATSPNLKNSNTLAFTLKDDQKPPELQLHGQLMSAINEAGTGEQQGQGGPELNQPLYNLKIDATDGVKEPKEGKDKRSGVRKIEVFLEGALQQTYSNASCPAGNCELHATYPLKLTGLSAGTAHHLTVKTYDFAGNGPETKEVEFEYEPATGISEDFVLQRFPLPDGKNHEGEVVNHGPELAVNVMNGNVVYHQRDIDVEGPAADLETELFYNSQLPQEQSSEWGRGWTLSQTPRLEATSGESGRVLTTRSAMTTGVHLPQEAGGTHFSNKLNALVTKQAGGGYAISEETEHPGRTTLYDASGQATEVKTSPTSSVDYSYASGKLSEIAVDDPGATTEAPPATHPAPPLFLTLLSAFGSSGSGNGQLSGPRGIATDGKGHVWVVDRANNRVEEFSEAGEYLSKFGTAGTGTGQFSEPGGIAITSAGNLWVADSGNHRIQEFSSEGKYLQQFGVKASGESKGTEFLSPEGIAVAPGGMIWVADAGGARVAEFRESVSTESERWVRNTSGTKATEPGGLAVDQAGNVLVADEKGNRVLEYSSEGAWSKTIGSGGSGDGLLTSPSGVGVGPAGNIYVVDRGNNRIQVFNPQGQFLSKLGTAGAGNGQFSEPHAIAFGQGGAIFATDKGNNRVQKWGAPWEAPPTFVTAFGTAGTGNGQLSGPRGVAADGKGHLWVVDRANNRVEEFSEGGEYLGKFGSEGTGNGQFSEPWGIAVTSEGNLWVADAANHRLQEFDSEGHFIQKFGTKAAGESNGTEYLFPEDVATAPGNMLWVTDSTGHRVAEFRENVSSESERWVRNTSGTAATEPAGLAVDASGNVWVADEEGNRVLEYGPEGAYLKTIGSAGTGNGQLSGPTDVGVSASGEIYVVDTGNSRIQLFTAKGEYLTKFGSAGSGNGQFSLPKTIAFGQAGAIFVTDKDNNRVHRWGAPWEASPNFVSAFGTEGSAPGQLNGPRGVAADGEGHVWVVDRANNRVEEFSEAGEYLSQFGSAGTGDGQFSEPWGIAVTPEGNLWVADCGNHRLQEFDAEGHFIQKFGTKAAGESKGTEYLFPEDVSPAPGHMLWVTDSSGHRVAEFRESVESESERWVRNTSGTSPTEPAGLSADAFGNVWVADEGNNRVLEYSPEGAYLKTIGSAGTGNGQLSSPTGVGISPSGEIYVVDTGNSRVQVFNAAGAYVTKFGSAGSGNGQFSLPKTIAFGADGAIFVTDKGHNRVHRWGALVARVPGEAETAPVGDDPKVAVQTTSGLVSKVSGAQAGSHTYSHEGELLSADQGPEGTTTYKYDGTGRMMKVTLPNGTIAEVAYDTTGRATKVTVDPAGSEPATSTEFSYTEEAGTENRETTVQPEGQKRTFYAIGSDGSVLRWWNAEVPPTFRSESGTLIEHRDGELGSGDQELFIEGHAAEGISKIQFIVNGSTVVDEREYEGGRSERENEHLQWITTTEELPPGTMWIEAVLTDSLEHIAAKRWWVTVPYRPPPPEGVPRPPKYKEVLHFREEFGLDLDLNPIANEVELHERVFETIGAWYNPQTPLGEVAYAAWERWGVPLRPADVADLEWREAYLAHDLPLIEEWATEHHGSTYGGYAVDNRAGGLIHVGFTAGQVTDIEELKAQLPLMAPGQVSGESIPPTTSLQGVESVEAAIEEGAETNEVLANDITEIGIDEQADAVVIGATDVGAVQSSVGSLVGNSAPVRVYVEEEGEPFSGRNQASGRIQAGDRVMGLEPLGNGQTALHECTANFGAWESMGTKPNGELAIAQFLLVAGHCAEKMGLSWARSAKAQIGSLSDLHTFGVARRTGAPREGQHYETDAAAIRLNAIGLIPTTVYKTANSSRSVGPAGGARHGEILCFSGVVTDAVKCGEMVGIRYRKWPKARGKGRHLLIITRFAGVPGDSGSPVWSPKTGRSIGILSGGPQNGKYKDWVTPLVRPRGFSAEKVPGALNAPGMGNLQLQEGS